MRAFRLAYDGTPYHGFQRQPDVPTVEGALFDALRDLGAFDGPKPDGYAAAGRTDAGVSALAQTVAFDAPEWLSPTALNGGLPPDVRAWATADARPQFHATHDAIAREYTYHLHAPNVANGAVRDALGRLTGTHDFHNLTPAAGDTIRTVRAATADRDGEFLVVTLQADGFLRRLVRRIVSLVRAIGVGDRDVGFVDRVLSAEELSGPDGIAPATPEPLVLTDVGYRNVDFAIDADAVSATRRLFESRRVERVTGARVAGTIRDGIDPL